jgi:hypothetical protein
MKFEWYQLAFAGLGAYIIYCIVKPPASAMSGLQVSPAVAAGATGGTGQSATPEIPAGVTYPVPDLGYNFSLKANNAFSPAGGSSPPPFLAYQSQLGAALSPIMREYLDNLSTAVQ